MRCHRLIDVVLNDLVDDERNMRCGLFEVLCPLTPLQMLTNTDMIIKTIMNNMKTPYTNISL